MSWLKGRAMARGILRAARVVLSLTLAQWALAWAGIDFPALWLVTEVIARAAAASAAVLVVWNVSSLGSELMRRAERDREPHPELLRVPEEFAAERRRLVHGFEREAARLRYMGPPPVFLPGVTFTQFADGMARGLAEYQRHAYEAAAAVRKVNAIHAALRDEVVYVPERGFVEGTWVVTGVKARHVRPWEAKQHWAECDVCGARMTLCREPAPCHAGTFHFCEECRDKPGVKLFLSQGG